MAKKKTEQGDKSLSGIEQALTRSERFIEDNQKLLINILTGVLAVVLLVILGNRYYLKPQNQEAASNMYMAERFFERDSFNLALNGYGSYPGFLEIIDEYGITSSGRLARYYAGICYKELGNYEEAIDYLKRYNTNDLLVGAASKSALGDAYAELGQYDKAIKSYMDGADSYKNDFSTPVILKKAGIVYEEMGELEKALEVYERIQTNYPESAEGREIKKYIGRVEAKLASV